MNRVAEVQIRCTGCNRRLADLVNEITTGQLLVELKCPRCGQPHAELIRAGDFRSPVKPSEVRSKPLKRGDTNSD